jgi:hypothetical protein
MATSLHFGNDMSCLKWSSAEKSIARKAFDLALKRELEEVIQKTKARAARIHEPGDLWDLESYLTRRRREIDRTYDYRYSMLPMVFGILLRKKKLSEEDLRGLGEDKLDYIRRVASL